MGVFTQSTPHPHPNNMGLSPRAPSGSLSRLLAVLVQQSSLSEVNHQDNEVSLPSGGTMATVHVGGGGGRKTFWNHSLGCRGLQVEVSSTVAAGSFSEGGCGIKNSSVPLKFCDVPPDTEKPTWLCPVLLSPQSSGGPLRLPRCLGGTSVRETAAPGLRSQSPRSACQQPQLLFRSCCKDSLAPASKKPSSWQVQVRRQALWELLSSFQKQDWLPRASLMPLTSSGKPI